MKVTVIVNGRFHAFDLAAQLEKRGMLHRILTIYPKFKTRHWGLPDHRVKTCLPLAALSRSTRYFPKQLRGVVTVFQKDLFSRWASANLPRETDLAVGWSSNSLRAVRKAKSLGIKTVLERGSSHILHQTKILREEYERLELKPVLPPKNIIKWELQEYKETDYIEVPSTFVYRTFLTNQVSPGKLIKGFRGVDLGRFRPVPKTDNIFRVIHCGSVSIQKGVHYLLQAFFELDLPRAELWLIGGMEKEIFPFIERYRSPSIMPKGHIPHFDLYRYMSQGSLFCLASIQDGFAMVIPQAMACGLPAICTDNTAGQDIVRNGEDGFVVSIRNIEALKEKILYFYRNPEAVKAMGESARQRVAKGFTWDSYGQQIIRKYRKILNTDTPIEALAGPK